MNRFLNRKACLGVTFLIVVVEVVEVFGSLVTNNDAEKYFIVIVCGYFKRRY